MKLSPQQILSLTGGFVAIVIALGLSSYIWFTMLTTVPFVAIQQLFPLTGAQNLLTSANLIKRAASLIPVPASQPEKIKYSTSELGKTDLTKLE